MFRKENEKFNNNTSNNNKQTIPAVNSVILNEENLNTSKLVSPRAAPRKNILKLIFKNNLNYLIFII